MSYRRRASPLHVARTGAALAWFGALTLLTLLFDHPLLLGAELVLVLVAGAAAGVGRELLGGLGWWVLFFALPIVLINALVTRSGLTVIARLGTVPVFGPLDVTLEATVYGLILAVRALLLVLVFRLFSAAVDPDEVLRMSRRLSLRSALTATLALRMVPMLRRDAHHLAEAQRCRPCFLRRAPRVALLRAVSAGALDRSLDLAAALELRGYGAVRRPARVRHPLSRHDLAFLASAAALVGLAAIGSVAALAPFSAYPSLHASPGWGPALFAAALAVVALAPFLQRRGIEG